MIAADLAFLAAVAAMTACNFYFGRRIRSDRIPMQWSFTGNPTWYAPKLAGLWGPVVLVILVRAFLQFAAAYAPGMVNGLEVTVLGFSVVVAAGHLGHLIAVSRWDVRQN
jgi:hypothetical protein